MATSLSKYKDAELIAEYWEKFGRKCEAGHNLPSQPRQKVERLRPYPQYRKLELHHIWHRSRHRIDSWSNVIIIDSIIHRNWGHDQNPIELTILCMYAKFEKMQKWKDLYDQKWNPHADEFNLDELRQAAGQCPLAWLGRQKYRYQEGSEWWCLCQEMIEFV